MPVIRRVAKLGAARAGGRGGMNGRGRAGEERWRGLVMASDDKAPRAASVLFHPNASTPAGRLSAEERRDAFIAELDRLELAFLAGENPYSVAGEVIAAAGRYVPEGHAQAIEELRELALGHRIQTFLRQCKLVRLAQDHPRGPLGAPDLMDAMQRPAEGHPMLEGTSPIGQAVMLRLLDLPGTAASRARRSLLATHIAAVAREVDGARILSVACGHALELDLVPAAARRRIAAWIGVDDNAAALAAAGRHMIGPGPVTVRRAGLRELVRDAELDGFDLIYAGGLLSYLPERDCRQLTRNLFRRLAPGGRLLLGGALPGDPGLGFREVFMNWPMHARDREQMLDFSRGIARAEIAYEDVVVEPNGCIGLLELVRA